jgi:hypothetical protein
VASVLAEPIGILAGAPGAAQLLVSPGQFGPLAEHREGGQCERSLSSGSSGVTFSIGVARWMAASNRRPHRFLLLRRERQGLAAAEGKADDADFPVAPGSPRRPLPPRFEIPHPHWHQEGRASPGFRLHVVRIRSDMIEIRRQDVVADIGKRCAVSRMSRLTEAS